MPLVVNIGIVLMAYVLGSLSPGYWLVRWRTGADLRRQFTGSTGARNAGRVLGRSGLIVTALLDVAKGALPVLVARALGLSDGWLVAVAIAVVAGHIWPVFLRFHGGRGLSPAIGAMLVLHPPTAIMILIVAGVMFGITRWANLAAMAAATATPYLALITGASPLIILGAGGLALLVAVAQLELVDRVRRWLGRGGISLPEPPGPGQHRSLADERNLDG